jgi:RNA polymerase sigma-70 factor (family 1)
MSRHVTSIEDCLVRLQARDQSALAYLIDHFYPVLCQYAFEIVHERQTAEDVALEAFTKLWYQQGNFQTMAAIRSFLYTTVRHRCIDQLRKQRVTLEYAAFLQQSPEHDEETANEQIIRAEVLAHIYAAVETLPDQCRSIFRLNFIEGLKNAEIAEALGLSVQTVKK